MLVASTEIEQFLFHSRNRRQIKSDARRMPDGTTHAPDSGVEFMALVSGASFWSVCHWLYYYYNYCIMAAVYITTVKLSSQLRLSDTNDMTKLHLLFP